MRNKANLGIHVSCLNVVIIIVSLFSSCAGETNIIDGNNNKLLNFSVSVPSWKNNDSMFSSKDSRATPITDTSLGTDKTFGIIADILDGSNYTTEINQEIVSYNKTDKIWAPETNHYWPGANRTVDFYAYYPAIISNGTLNHTAGSAPTLTYTVPDDATNQEDIMTSTSTDISGTTYSSTSISFKHILSAIKFSVGTSGMPSGTIKSISITGVKTSGTYTFNGSWVLGSTSTDVTTSPSTKIAGTSGASITSGTYTFLMIPQTLNSNATITVTYSNGTAFSQTISGTWAAGNTYTYNLSKTIPVTSFTYTGSVQIYTVPFTGSYKIECWGASGADSNASLGGKGGYTNGIIQLTQGTNLYLYVGQSPVKNSQVAGWNGGGKGVTETNSDGTQIGYAGGGATDVRLINSSDCLNLESLKTRIMVAGGGGGAGYSPYGCGGGGAGGGINGLSGIDVYMNYYFGTGGTQTSGGGKNLNTTVNKGGLGYGGTYAGGGVGGSAGGAGYYGGGASDRGHGGGGGGSSYISGYSGCTTFSSIYIFTSTSMIAGNASMSAPGGGIETGHSGNGYARITFVSAN